MKDTLEASKRVGGKVSKKERKKEEGMQETK